MSRFTVFALFFLAVFLQSGTYGLTFMLPNLFAEFGANEKDVGRILMVTTAVTLITVYYSGHLSDWFGRVNTLGISGFSISIALLLFGSSEQIGSALILASGLIGFGWGLMYTLAPVVLTGVSGPTERVRVFSFYAVFLMAGFGLSPVLASALENSGYRIRDAFYTVAILCLVSGMLFLLLSKPISRFSKTDESTAKSSLSLGVIIRIFRSRGWLPVVMVFIGASVFAGMNNFQTVFAQDKGQDYADFFLAYTITVVVCRALMAGFSGGKSPYRTMAVLMYIMFASILVFAFVGESRSLYILAAILFGIGYGASYPVLAAMAANDAHPDLVPHTLQLFALTYFIGIFGFPFVAGWTIVEHGISPLLLVIAILALIEATMAVWGHLRNRKTL